MLLNINTNSALAVSFHQLYLLMHRLKPSHFEYLGIESGF